MHSRPLSRAETNNSANSRKEEDVMKYRDVSLGRIEAVLNKLGGTEGLEKFLAGKTILVPNPRLKVWQNIEIERWRGKEYYLTALKAGNAQISEGAKQIIEEINFKRKEEVEEIDLVKMTVGQLGFRESARFKDICQRARKLGLELCPPQVALELCLQENGFDTIYIGMRPIVVKSNDLLIFCISYIESESGQDFWFQSSWAADHSHFQESDEWIFALPAV